MNFKRVLLFIGSIAIAVILFDVLIKMGKVDIRTTYLQLKHANLVNVALVFLFNCILVYLSSFKWRLVDTALRSTNDVVPSRVASFFITSIGMALGIILPMQVAMTLARTIGTHAYGKAVKRGTAGTVFEQCFDLLIVFFLSIASWITWFFSGTGFLWASSALVMVAIALLSMGSLVHFVKRFFRFASRRYNSIESKNTIDATPGDSWIRPKIDTITSSALRYFMQIEHSGLLNAALARRLMLLSAIRFTAIVLLADQTAAAVNINIGLWRLAAAMPFVSIANVLGITPGGVGVTELTIVSMLHLFGTPLNLASQWAVDYRLLGILSYFLVALFAFILFLATCFMNYLKPDALHEDAK